MNETHTTGAFDADVAIIGYGPSGVVAANTLGLHGVSTIAFERDREIHPRARAVTVNDWTMRIFQALGLDGVLKKDMDAMRALRWITYDGAELLGVGFPPSSLGGGTRFYSIYQPVMESSLRAGAERFPEHVSVRYGAEVVGVAHDATGVTVTARDEAGTESSVRVRYVLACDGGSSPTRAMIGARLEGGTIDTTWLVVDCRVRRWWPDRNLLTFWCDAERPVVDIALALGNHRWELPLRPEESPADFPTSAEVWPLLRDMGITEDDVEIHQHAFYRHHSRMADRWRAGRVFLVGDAAHLMAPWAGSGMQSGMRDAYDISWKLARVLRGDLPESFLNTYEAERRPNVAMFIEMSEELGRIVRLELGEAEMAALTAAPPEGEPAPEPPLIQPPVLAGGWLRGPVGDGVVGRMLPQPSAADPRGRIARLDDLLGDGFVLLGDEIDPRDLLSAEERAGWDALDARYLTVRPVDKGTETDAEIVDVDGVLCGWMRGFGVRAVAVRPDRFVAACDAHGLAVPA
ncbi:bifunctional 3-(3-hydroxy-phenyl)propionate/3-hydroxycinnamic acid hydroxylase [Actinocorallia sp. A-T 12471]|uniref:bifunctional 3-(3-hydroxy-phenyl)propionate/3-hydroxycinnamic acid hydroxylase n=1 Tax=Actinocorallia sp. A-T 12471 TaxID=3089813 RepID=UPI0029CF6BD0|nr:bifunctional 3-(3-hydroxy-phenyl)propionate/3-hydroxycinnamic acid hydroxylase [Actinocorallia sp. A-T 12471]MDX6740783.1 bifunctional 3-(3-hydroxy-phenyl)propionate/3-hydroxycinnamic acid hydroxylase [Actinocorallia sp. A-T 12471]